MFALFVCLFVYFVDLDEWKTNY